MSQCAATGLLQKCLLSQLPSIPPGTGYIFKMLLSIWAEWMPEEVEVYSENEELLISRSGLSKTEEQEKKKFESAFWGLFAGFFQRWLGIMAFHAGGKLMGMEV